MNCMQCSKPVQLSISGLGNFCSWECRKLWKSKKNKATYAIQLHRKTYQRSCSSNSVTITDGNIKEKNTLFVVSETTLKLIDELGGRKWYDLAKRLCCNFDVRAREGYCVYLFDPNKSHKNACNRCELGQGLMRYDAARNLACARRRVKHA